METPYRSEGKNKPMFLIGLNPLFAYLLATLNLCLGIVVSSSCAAGDTRQLSRPCRQQSAPWPLIRLCHHDVQAISRSLLEQSRLRLYSDHCKERLTVDRPAA